MSIHIKKFDVIKFFCGIEGIEQDIEFKDYNVIFAENGVGKTSLSRAFWLLVGDNHTQINKHKSIGQNDEPYLSLNDNTITINKDNKPSLNFNIEIYNTDFLKENVPLDTEFEIKKIDGKNILKNSGIGKENKEIQRLSVEIEEAEKRKNEIYGDNEELKNIENSIKLKENEIEKIRANKITSRNIQINLDDITIENDILDEQEKSCFYYDENQKLELQQNFDELNEALKKFDELQEVEFIKLNIDRNKLIEIFNFDIEKEAGVVSEEIKNHIIKMGREFIEKGKELIKVNNLNACPFCMQKINNGILEQYTHYFNEKIERFNKDIGEQIVVVNEAIESFNEIKNDILNKFEKFKPFIDEFEIKNKELSENLENLIDSIHKLVKFLEQRQGIKDFNNFKQLDLDTKIKNINDILIITKDILENKKTQQNNLNQIKQQLREIKIKQGKYETFEFQKAKYDLSMQQKKYADELEILTKKINENTKKIQQIQTLNRPDINTINNYLKVLNLSKYTLNADYQIVINANSIQNENRSITLSESEKTTIGFAYFLARLKLLYDKDTLKNLVIVFDDPISSLDENRIYMTSYLVSKINKEIADEIIESEDNKAQIFVLTHNYTFMTNIIRMLGKHAQYNHLLRKNNELIFEHKNETAGYFDSFYLLTFKDVFVFAKDDNLQDDYNKALNYGNKIRILLESFIKSNFISEFIVETYLNQSPLKYQKIESIIDIIIDKNKQHNFVADYFKEECCISDKNDLVRKLDLIVKGLHMDSHGSIADLYAQHKTSLQEVQNFAKIAINIMFALNPNQVLFYIQAAEA